MFKVELNIFVTVWVYGFRQSHRVKSLSWSLNYPLTHISYWPNIASKFKKMKIICDRRIKNNVFLFFCWSRHWFSCSYFALKNLTSSLGHRANLGSRREAAFPTSHAQFWLHPGSRRGVFPPIPPGADGHVWLPVPGQHADPLGNAFPLGPRKQLRRSLQSAIPPGGAVRPPEPQHQTVPSLEEGQEDTDDDRRQMSVTETDFSNQ